jgi:hypothetical protein
MIFIKKASLEDSGSSGGAFKLHNLKPALKYQETQFKKCCNRFKKKIYYYRFIDGFITFLL